MGCRPSSPEPTPEPTPQPTTLPTEVHVKRGSYRPSIASLQIPGKEFTDDVSSDGISEHSLDGDHENKDYLCGTEVTLQWLLQRLSDKYEREIPSDPQWITERLNKPKWDDYATSSVIRVTFGWGDEDDLPKSLILKLPIAKDQRDDEEGKFHYIMFKRECNVYEWTQKYPKLASPKMFHIKKHSKETGSGVIVMEDVAEKGIQQDAFKGLTVEVVRDLVHQLAFLHAQSIRHTSWSTLIADLPPSYYNHITSDFDKTMEFFENQDVDHSRFTYSAKYFSRDYLHSTATESAEELKIDRTLIHGEPYASNVFILPDQEESKIAGIIDWTECHSGCFAEDVAKAICWNLSLKDRMECTGSLLEGYHYYFNKYCEGKTTLSLETIRKAYEKFIPFAMVTLVAKTMQVREKNDVEPLIERAKGLIENVYATAQLMEIQNS